MAHGNLGGPVSRRHLLQKSVTEITGGMFTGQPLLPGIGNNLHPSALAGKPQDLGGLLHQTRLCLSFQRPQPMVHMGNHQKKVKNWGQLHQDLKQSHGVWPAGNRHDTALSGNKKPLTADGFFYFSYEKMHTSRLVVIIPLKKRLSLAM